MSKLNFFHFQLFFFYFFWRNIARLFTPRILLIILFEEELFLIYISLQGFLHFYVSRFLLYTVLFRTS